MAVKCVRRNAQIGRTSQTTCIYWQMGRCNRNPCRFLHAETPLPHNTYGNANNNYNYKHGKKTHSSSDNIHKNNSKTVLANKSTDRGTETCLVQTSKRSSPSICKYWINSNCVHAESCQNLHSWFYGDGFSMLTKLQEHKKVITGIALRDGSNHLYTGSTDGTVRTWDCHTCQCVRVINLGAEVTSLISEGPWIFIDGTQLGVGTNDEKMKSNDSFETINHASELAHSAKKVQKRQAWPTWVPPPNADRFLNSGELSIMLPTSSDT